MLRAVLTLPALGLAIAMALGSPASAEPPAAAAPGGFVRPEPPGRLVDVGGRRLHIRCVGEGAPGVPVVIFEAGLSQYTANSTYGAAQAATAAAVPGAKVCTYDRAGMGWSDAAPVGWTVGGMTADLDRLLRAEGITGKVVLVGHSFGGLLARAFVRAHPDRVAGVVLADSTSDRDAAGFDAAALVVIPQIDQAVANAKPGQPVIGLPVGSAPELVMSFTPEILKGVKAEFEAWGRLDPALKTGGLGTMGDLPLIVIARGKTAATPPNAEDVAHREGQEALSRLSTRGVLVVAENSGHAIPLDEPGVVADAVKRVVEAANGAPLR